VLPPPGDPWDFGGGSPFGGIPRNWKQVEAFLLFLIQISSPFGGIPRNWKR